MSVDASLVADLRKRTGSGIRDCKKALQECEGDMEKAVEFLRKKGLAAADSKSDRSTTAGRVISYIHDGGQVGVMLELACETDFVANTEQFQELGRDLCMQICAMSPIAVSRDTVDAEVVEKEKEIYREQMKEQLSGKPENVQDKILSGKIDKFFQENTLLEQNFIKDDKATVEGHIKNSIATLKENISVKRFVRFEIGAEG